MFTSVIVGIPLLAVLIFIHELGHFLLAKWCGVGVLRFSIGFGPSLLRFRFGETTYQICAIPLGGYVRMVGDISDAFSPIEEDKVAKDGKGEDDAENKAKEVIDLSEEDRKLLADRSRWFIEKPIWKRSLIVFAGPLFNLLFAVFLLSSNLFLYGKPSEIVDKPLVGEVGIDSPAEQSGIKQGDLIFRFNEKQISSWEELALTIHDGGPGPHKLGVNRQGQEMEISVSPQERSMPFPSGDIKKLYLIGIGPEIIYEPVGLSESIKLGTFGCYSYVLATYDSLVGMIAGRISTDELAGPIRIFQVAGKKAEQGFLHLLDLAVKLSISLGVLNLLPIPVLDGGHLLFFLIEAVLGPLSLRKREIAQQIGVVALLLLMVFAVHNDIKATIRSSSSEAKTAAQDVGSDANSNSGSASVGN